MGDYLEKHKIHNVLAILTSSLVYKEPYSSRRYIIDYLVKLKEVRDEYVQNKSKLTPMGPEHPYLTGKSLVALFKIADPTETGMIPSLTAQKITEVLGIEQPETVFTEDHDSCTMSFFVSTLHDALLR